EELTGEKVASAYAFEDNSLVATDTIIFHLVRLIESIESFEFKKAALYLIEIASWGNSYLQYHAPWTLAKENPNNPRIAEILFVSNQVSALLVFITEFFIPFVAERLKSTFSIAMDFTFQGVLQGLTEGKPILPSGHSIGKTTVLFPKIIDRKDDSRKQIVDRQKEKLEQILATERGPERPPVKEEIIFDDFTKLDLRTATITAATKVPKADKLLQLTLDVGFEERTVLSGIAQHYEPEAIIGQQVVLVANLAPRKMRGVLSQGMVLMAENEEGKLVFVNPSEGFGNGWVVR
ncbi:MAG: methionine--tRNA ligase subunit beta, partial [Bacteroidota bacterium]